MTSLMLRVVFCLVCLLAVGGGVSTTAAQDAPPSWLSTMIWAPSLPDAGAALAEHLNQVDAACDVDIDVVQSTNGATADGAVYAFLVVWSCPDNPNLGGSGSTWQSTLIWQPTLADAGAALSEHLNQIDPGCRVDVDTIQSTNGAGPEGPVYAFSVASAC